MKTTGVSWETKFGLLVFLGHPNTHTSTGGDVRPEQAGDLGPVKVERFIFHGCLKANENVVGCGDKKRAF